MRLLQRGRHHFPQTTVKDAPSHANTRTAGWLPSLSAMIWLTLFLGLTLSSARIVLISADSDSALHRRLGEWVIKHHAVVRDDNLLHTYHGPFVSMEWLGGLLFTLAARLCDWNGIVLIAAIVIATCYWLLHRQLLAEGCDAILATGLVLIAMLACSIHWLARPLIFTHLLVLIYAWQLRWFQKGRVSTQQLFLLLPALMVLWVNLHGGFALGLVLLAMYAGGSAITTFRRSASWDKPRALTILLFVCGAASFVNPHGWRLHFYILDFLRSPELSTVTSEFASPNFHAVGMRGFQVLLLLLTAILLIIRPQLDATDVLLVGGWGYLALFSARNVPIFALVVTPLLAQWITEFLQGNRDAWWSSYYSGWASRIIPRNGSAGVAFVIAAVVCVTLIMAKPAIAGGPPVLVTDFPADRYPTEVVAYLREHPTLIHGEMFSSSLWSGYLEFSFPEHKPFIDSRADFYGLALIREFRTVSVPKPGWEAVLARYHVGWTMLPPQHPLNQILQLSPDWRLVFSNRQALVYSRKP